MLPLGLVCLDENETFKLNVDAYDAIGLDQTQIACCLSSIPLQFTAYASAETPLRTEENEAQLTALGIEITYYEVEQEWVVDFGREVTSQIVAEGELTFSLTITDIAGNKFGTINETTPRNTFTYSVIQEGATNLLGISGQENTDFCSLTFSAR